MQIQTALSPTLRPAERAQSKPSAHPPVAASAERVTLNSAAEAESGFSLGKMAAGALLGFMGRRIPTTMPEISSDKAQSLKEKIRPGDVLMTADGAYPGWARMEFWAIGSHYTHAALVGSDGQVYEAVGEGVIQGSLDEFLQGRLKVAVARPGLDEAGVERATEYCRGQLGKAYDGFFNTEDDKEFYCSELVAKALATADPSVQTPTKSLLGKKAIAPDVFLSAPGFQPIHDDGSHYWKNKLSYWPLGAAAVGVGAAGYAIGGLAGAVVGASAGFVGSVLIGNKMQTGHYSPSLAEVRSSKTKVSSEVAPR